MALVLSLGLLTASRFMDMEKTVVVAVPVFTAFTMSLLAIIFYGLLSI